MRELPSGTKLLGNLCTCGGVARFGNLDVNRSVVTVLLKVLKVFMPVLKVFQALRDVSFDTDLIQFLLRFFGRFLKTYR